MFLWKSVPGDLFVFSPQLATAQRSKYFVVWPKGSSSMHPGAPMALDTIRCSIFPKFTRRLPNSPLRKSRNIVIAERRFGTFLNGATGRQIAGPDAKEMNQRGWRR